MSQEDVPHQLLNYSEREDLSDYEKKRYSNLIKNWEVLKSIGITPKLPEFLMPKKKNSGNAKICSIRQRNANSLLNAKFKPFAVPNTRKKLREKSKNQSQETKMIVDKEKETKKKISIREVNKKDIVEILLEKADIHHKRLQAFTSGEIQLVDKKIKSESKRHYPKRNIIKKSYKEEDISSDDEFLYCDDCGCDYKGACPKHGPMLWVCDTKVPKNSPERAAETLPDFFSIGRSGIPKAGLGVWTEVPLSKGMVFGPYKGSITRSRSEAQKSGYAWMVWKGGKADHYVEGVRKDASSWLRFVNCVDREWKQNLVAFQYKKKIYYKTYKHVLPFQELLVWYGGEYAVDLGIDISLKTPDNLPTRVEGYGCDICSSLFTSLDDMERHRKEHRHVGHDRRHHCPHCDYSTDHTTNLRRHLSVHSGEREHKCRHCHKEFTHESNLRVHERIHTGEKPFSCTVCGRAFNHSSHLLKHKRVHSNHRPHRCSTCGKDFTDLSNLHKHKRVHTQQRPYKCSHCDYRSSASYTLTRHVILKHTKQFPHTCSHCSQGFFVPSTLRKHLEKRHS